MRALLVIASLALAACGADGDPVTPTMNATIGHGASGTYLSGGVGFRRGPFGLFVGL